MTEREDPEVVSDLLALVGIEAPAAVVATWTPEMQTAAADWAGGCHLSASDNDNVVPPRPPFIPEPWNGPTQGEGIWATNPTPMIALGVSGTGDETFQRPDADGAKS